MVRETSPGPQNTALERCHMYRYWLGFRDKNLPAPLSSTRAIDEDDHCLKRRIDRFAVLLLFVGL